MASFRSFVTMMTKGDTVAISNYSQKHPDEFREYSRRYDAAKQFRDAHPTFKKESLITIDDTLQKVALYNRDCQF